MLWLALLNWVFGKQPMEPVRYSGDQPWYTESEKKRGPHVRQ